MVLNNTNLPPRRSNFITVLAWLSIIVSGLAMPISFITFLMVLAGSYGTERVDLLGWLTIVAGPPVSLAAGIGLLYRRPWALVYFRVLIFLLLAFDVYQIIRIFFFTSNTSYADSYQNSLLATGVSYVLPALIWTWLFVKLFSRNLRSEFLIIYFASPQRWQNYPDWACHRRDEIIARTKSQFREPDYLYDGDVPQAELQESNHLNERPAESPKVSSARQPTHTLLKNPPSRQYRLVSLLPVAILLSITAVMFWLAMDGVIKGETVLPSKHVTQQRDVSRLQEPALFWLSIGIYTVIGAGSLGLVVWGIRETCRQRKSGG